MLVGRRREQTVLEGALARAARGSPTLVLVTGEAGIGKTTLVDDFARGAQRAGYQVLRGIADDRDLSGLALWDGPFAALGVEPSVRDGAQRPEVRWEVVELLAAALDAVAPVVLVVEDIHWADAASLWLLGQLPSSLAGDVVIVATSRHAKVDRVRPALTIALHGLSIDDVVAMVAERRPSDTHDRDEAARLLERSGGNPLLVVELLARHDAGESGWSPTIESVLGAALDELSPTTLRALAALAVAEPHTPYAVIAGAVGIDIVELRAAFDEALHARVLVEVSPVRVSFRHALLADAARATLDAAEARAMHRALAESWIRASTHGAPAVAAMHALHAVPAVDPVEAAVGGGLAAAARIEDGDLTSAVRLLSLAVEALELYAGGETALRARLLIDLADAHMLLGEQVDAEAAYELAVASSSTDPELNAQAVYGLSRRMQMYVPDRRRRALLEAAEHALPAGDSRLRALLLGRLAVANMSDPRTWPAADRYSEEAVEMGRRLGDAALLGEMLVDRHLGCHDRNALERRAASAEELVALGQTAGRSDLVLIGLQRRYDGAVMHGDVDAANTALDEMDTIAALMPSPEWRYGALLRRAMLAALAGDVDRARLVIDEAAAIGRRVLAPQEALGMEAAARVVTSRLTGVTDRAIVDLRDEIEAVGGLPPSAFFRIQAAAMLRVVGRHDEARAIVERWASVCTDTHAAIETPAIEVLLGSLVAEFGLTEYAPHLYRRLVPYAGCFTVETGFGADLPIDLTLMRLAIVSRDVAAARLHRDGALRIAATMRSPVLEAHARWLGADVLAATGLPDEAAEDRRIAMTLVRRIGMVLPDQPAEPTVPPSDRVASLGRSGGTWVIASPYGGGEMADTAGLGQLARLLAAAPGAVAATDLAGMTDVAPANDLGPALDPTAKRAYRRRIEELRAEIDESDGFADIERASRARRELDALMTELRRAVGLRGRDRPTGAGAERARVNVARSVRRAIAAVRSVAPDLAAHLDVSVRTGRSCSYAPEPATALTWRIETG